MEENTDFVTPKAKSSTFSDVYFKCTAASSTSTTSPFTSTSGKFLKGFIKLSDFESFYFNSDKYMKNNLIHKIKILIVDFQNFGFFRLFTEAC